RGELWSLPLTMVVLVLAFGALVAATLPVVIGFFAIGCTLAVITVLAKFTPMSVFVLNMTSMIGLGVGIDYSLLVVTRFREEMNRGLSRRDAAVRTLMTAGKAVVTSGLTVMVGFAALLATPLIETRSVGLGGLVVVLMAIALSTTLLIPILAVLGREIDRPRWLSRRLAWYHSPRIWEKWARTLSRHPRRALLLGGTAVAILTAPLFLIRIGLPANNWWPAGTEAGAGVETLERMGAAGVIQPVRVLVEVPEGGRVASAAHLRGLRALSDSLRNDPRVGDVKSIVDLRPGASIFSYSVLYSDLDRARARYPGFVDAYLSGDGRATLLDVIPADSTSLTSTMDLVRDIRGLARDGTIPRLDDATILVGGYAASNVDLQTDLLRRFPLMIVLILVTTGIMLAVAFRSILVPLKAIVMNTLAVSATFGLIVLVFQYGMGSALFGLAGPTSAIYVVIPVLVFAVVFGLSMDYEVFLLTRIKEAFDKTGKNDQATMEGLSATASVITSAALIMIIVFGVFAFSRVLAMQFLGFGLAVAVLLDATLIRMVLVPAFMHLAGEWNWWPGYRKVPRG
ncbi:MAG: MMPL family transporter, partial [Gemmatimonadales bacterium]